MLKKLQKSDYVFIIAMLAGLIMHMSCIYGADHFADESFYPTIPLRLMNGDSLVQDEWHLTQFSSLFLYLPVRIWLAIKGSTDGIILFLRYFYLIIHTLTATGIYTYFRKYKIWAVAAVLMFYTQVPLRFMSINYHSMLALFLLLLTISLFTICKKDKVYLYLIAGFCYGCCCVSNPFECLVFPIYIIACLIWCIKSKFYKKKLIKASTDDALKIKQECEIRNKYFGTKAFFKFCAGLGIAALVSIIFFFGTGGTISELINNIPYLLNDPRHDIFASPLAAFIEKISTTSKHINSISFGLPFLLPLFYLILLIDKHRRKNSHRLVFIILSLAMSIFFVIGVTIGALNSSRCLAITLPFAIISTVCYILTENKNKNLFYCMWLPSAIATVIQYLASDLHLSVMWVLTIGNIAGVFFVKDFVAEFISSQSKVTEKEPKGSHKLCVSILCIGICLQLILQCGLYLVGKTVKADYLELTRGPYKGLYYESQSYNSNNAVMNDLDTIKECSNPDDPVLIISEFSWMYLYVERPFATYSAWQPFLEAHRLRPYYIKNPDKIPKYIYIGYITIPSSVLAGHGHNATRAQNYASVLKEMFDCEEEILSNGILLTVKEQKLLP